MAKAMILLFLFSFSLIFPKVEPKCPKSFQCGSLGSLSFPFSESSDCGILPIERCNSGSPRIHLSHESRLGWYGIVGNNISKNELTLFSEFWQRDLNSRSCTFFKNLSLLQSPFVSFTFFQNLTTFFTCFNQTDDPNIQYYFHYHPKVDCQGSPTVYYRNNQSEHNNSRLPTMCSMIQLPTKSSQLSGNDHIFDALSAEFSVKWNVSQECYECYGRGGQCVTDDTNKFHCKEGTTRLGKIIFIGGMAIAAPTSILIIVFVFIRRKRAKAKQELEEEIQLFLKNNIGSLAPMRYKYSTIKKMTNSFSESLGRGGFGRVYRGELPDDGHLVAVKVLNESNENGEDFMNEVASISRTSHINIVTLLGYCFEGSKRALIYDFMPNGSLEKFIGNNALGLDKLFEIALGIARGLEYLHQGCNTRILHLDIKPQNILLDKDMNPRISDFGLAKMCPNRSSIVTMLAARGTIGYIAPEVFSRSFGEVSYKSDVYSYGMLVLEMVGGRGAIDPREVDRTSETYFPHYLYKQLEMNEERDGDLVEHVSENQLAKRNLIIVGLWCVQTNPKDRPTMTKVVEMLEGKVESLEVPPRPYLYSPPRSAPSFSISESL